MPVPVVNVSKPFRRSRLGFHRFYLAITRRCIRYERFKQMMRGMRDFIDRAIECFLVCFRRLRETAQFSDELQRRRLDFIIGRGRTEVVKCFDSSAHEELLTADDADQHGFFYQQLTPWRAVALAEAAQHSKKASPARTNNSTIFAAPQIAEDHR